MSLIKQAPVKVLIVDDDEDDFMITKTYIEKIEGRQFIIDPCYHYTDAEKKIHEGSYHVYVVSYRLGTQTGLELIQESIANNCEGAFILLTGNGSPAPNLPVLEPGAADYLVKEELSTEKLERCIRYCLDKSASIKSIRARETRFRHIFERSKDSIFIADEQLFFTEVNNAFTELLEYSRKELLEKNLAALLSNSSEAVNMQQQLDQGGNVLDKELEILTKSGDKKYCIIYLSREKDSSGVIYIQGTIHDITGLKLSEKNRVLSEKLDATSRLVRMMAHELRNPLNNIMLSAEQLSEFMDGGESKICLDIINRNSKRIGHLITELLNSSRRDPVTLEKISLQDILEETIDTAADRINLQRVRLHRDFIHEPAWIMANNEKLKIAFLHIIINAVEAMHDMEIEGELSIFLKKKNTQYIVSIQDNGCGINEEDIPLLFEPYFTTKPNRMGLGLASTLNILQSHHGAYEVQSNPGQGTVFHLFFNTA